MLKLGISALGLLLVSAAIPAQQSQVTGIIQGIVIRSDTREPVAGAEITLIATDTPRAIPAPVRTDNTGKFTFPSLSTGSYRLMVLAIGFVQQGSGRTLFITAGQTLNDVVIPLDRFVTMTGTVVDESGRPAIGATVQLLRVSHTEFDRKFQPGRSATTDDRGQYRIYDVPPGRYLLFAGTPVGPSRPGTDRYNLVFYPDTENVEQAATVEVKAGVDGVLNMRVRKQTETYRVSGRVIDPTGMWPLRSATLSLVHQGYGTTFSIVGRPANIDPVTGTFEIPNLTPGSYTVSVQVPSAVVPQPSAGAPIRVINSNVENLILTLQTPVTAAGRIIVEDRPIASVPNLDGMQISFWPPVAAGDSPYAMAAAPDGKFEVRGLRDGEYAVKIERVPPGFYVKSLQYEQRDILANRLTFIGPRTGTFEMTLRAAAGQVAGVVTDSQSRPESGIETFLIPVQRNRIDLYRIATTDSQGRFSLTGVAPGEYQIFSWGAAESGAQYDPDFLKQYERQGLGVRVEESSNLTLNVKVISAP
jgi:hypothetical protein